MSIKISIVTISYNQGRFLKEAIASVLAQADSNLEYIIVDGGSTDESINIIKSYKNLLGKVIIEKDGGPADALNKGFAKATGDIYGFLNADDTLLPGCISCVREAFSKYDVDFVSGNCLVTDSNGLSLRKAYSDRFSTKLLVYDACILMQPATFFTRDIYQRVGGFNPNNRISWDSELFFEFGLARAKHRNIDKLLATYRLHEDSITGAAKGQELRARVRDRNLSRYLGRSPNIYDLFLKIFYRYLRKIRNPRDTLERVRYGKIHGRFTKKEHT